MNTASLRAGRLFASALLCFAPASLALAGAPFTLIRAVSQTLTPAALRAAEKAQTPGKASPDGKTLTFAQKTVRIVAGTGPENDMLSYRVGGLRNPTLVVTKGTMLTVLFVNTDDDMAHDIRFGPALPAYPNAPGSYGHFCTGRGHAQGGMAGKVIVR